MSKEIDWSQWLSPDASTTLWQQMGLVMRLSVPGRPPLMPMPTEANTTLNSRDTISPWRRTLWTSSRRPPPMSWAIWTEKPVISATHIPPKISGGLPVWLGGAPDVCPDSSRYFFIYACALPAVLFRQAAGSMLHRAPSEPTMAESMYCMAMELTSANMAGTLQRNLAF